VLRNEWCKVVEGHDLVGSRCREYFLPNNRASDHDVAQYAYVWPNADAEPFYISKYHGYVSL